LRANANQESISISEEISQNPIAKKDLFLPLSLMFAKDYHYPEKNKRRGRKHNSIECLTWKKGVEEPDNERENEEST